MFGILFETVIRFFSGGSIPEPLAVLIFGIGLFGATAVMRSFFNNRNAKKLMIDINDMVVVENS